MADQRDGPQKPPMPWTHAALLWATIPAVLLISLVGVAALVSSPASSITSCRRAAFPSVLHTDGRVITDANGCELGPMKGFSIQIGPWASVDVERDRCQGR